MGDAAELAMEAEMRYPYMDPVDAYAQYCDDLVSKNEKMNKLSFVFEAPNDMTAKQARIIIEQALEWAASDYAACQKENDKYPTDDDEYQKKYDALDSLTLMDVEPVDYIDDYWAEIPDYPSEDWQHEVTSDNTRQGYHDWAKSQKEMSEDDGS